MMRASILIAAAMLASPVAAWAGPTNCAQFEILNQGIQRTYNPFSPSEYVDVFTLRVLRTDPNVSSVRFLLVDSTGRNGAPKFGTDGPDLYTIDWLEDRGRRVFVTTAESVTDLNSARVGFARARDMSETVFRLSIGRGQQAYAGRYAERLVVRYQCYAGSDLFGTQQEQYNGQTELAVTVPRIVSAYVGGTGQQRGEIAFGELGNGAALVRNASVTALSTLPYAVDIATDNGQRLRRGRDQTGAIGYRLKYAGITVPGATTIACPVTQMPVGDVKLLEVALDPAAVASQPAGDYSDTITLTFRPSDGYAGSTCTATTATAP
ncbi:hypothetical protein E2E30_00170 [Sphingomonas sp. AAP5]|jgi:hypothetical protein|uniref:hypothetical protein n=1 Tax=Sphingomonas sp. AAP5 TaxID=1523415 RepID=UPI001056E489|nr:hypothetical protein [Sphingomonas sp. AAP5]QBM74337.1 hypothetical protein E2E30_00170 [Sphingomonas sp. AAP5]